MTRIYHTGTGKCAKQKYCRLLTDRTKKLYKSIGSVYCPALKEKVIFNARGFHHLNYDSDGTPRNLSERIYKLTLFALVIPVIKGAKVVAGERTSQIKVGRSKRAPFKSAKTYSLVAKVGRKKPAEIRVILLRIGSGRLTFLSVMKDNKKHHPRR